MSKCDWCGKSFLPDTGVFWDGYSFCCVDHEVAMLGTDRPNYLEEPND